MKGRQRKVESLSRFLLATAGSILFALSFPPFSFWPLAWCALVPVFAATAQSPGRAFATGWWAGFVFHAFLLSWLARVAGPFYLLVAAYLAMFWAAFFFILAGVPTRGKIFVGASAWLFLEVVVRYLFSGFPWLPVSLSQTTNPGVLPLAALAGAGGISFLVILSNLILFFGFRRTHRVSLVIALGIGIFCTLAARTVRGLGNETDGQPLPIAGVQPNVAPARNTDAWITLDKLIRDTARQVQSICHDRLLVIWPESSFSSAFLEDQHAVCSVLSLVREMPVPYCWLLFGGIHSRDGAFFNAAFLVRRTGSIDIRAKRHLVPFGEYLPGARYRPVADTYRRIAGYEPFLSPGHDSRPLSILPAGQPGVLICFENIFPELVRETVRSGADCLIVITNDSWYGHGPFARRQHFSHNILRSAEACRDVAQVSLDGISGVVSPRGTVIEIPQSRPGGSPTSSVLFATLSRRSGLTPFVEFGDLPLFLLCLVVTGAALCRH